MHAHADSRTTVLIVSDDPTAAAPLGGLVETLGYRPEFATALTSSGSFRQKRPQACLVDCQSDSCDEPSIARAIMRGLPVVLIGPRSMPDSVREIAARHGAELLIMPPEPGPLGEVLDRAVRRASA
jgi:DNA-binding NtrC family response regulator